MKYINASLIALTILAIYVIVTVGLDIPFLKLGSFENADNINFVLVNLSFSYIAAFIFYLLVTKMPFIMEKNKSRQVISKLADHLAYMLNVCVEVYETKNIENVITTITKDDLLDTMGKKSLFDISYISQQIDPNSTTTNFFIIKQVVDSINYHIDSILIFKEYLTSEQLKILINIRHSSYFNMIGSVKKDTSYERRKHEDESLKISLANDFYDLVILTRNLLNTVKLKTSDD